MMTRLITTLLLCATAYAHGQTVNPHPRINLTPARLIFLKQQVTANALRWQLVKKAADAGDMPAQALVYQCTGDVTYAQKAVTQLFGVYIAEGVAGSQFSGGAWYNCRTAFPSCARTFDWCYDQMTAAQRSQAAKWLMDNADACWARPGQWGVSDPANNYWWGFCFTGMAGLAVGADDPRGATHAALWVSKINTLAVPIFQGESRGGYFLESSGYDKYGPAWLGQQCDAYKTATGTDVVTGTPIAAFLTECVNYSIHSSTPDLKYFWPMGDQARSSQPVFSDHDRQRILPAIGIVGGKAGSDGQFFLNSIVTNPGQAPGAPTPSWQFLAVAEFLFYNPSQAATDYRSTQPNSYFAPGPGVFFFRQNWTPSATMFGVWSGPEYQSHQELDSNGLMIYKGGWLLTNANIEGASGILQNTASFNNITVGGKGQMSGYSGQVQAHEVGADWVYFRGQAAQPYQIATDTNGGRAIIATDVTRKIVYIPDADLFVISDRVAKVNASDTTEFHLHSRSAPVLVGNSASWDNGAYKAVLTSQIAPVIVPELYGSGGAVSSYRLDEVGSGGSGTDRLINTLQVIPLGGPVQPASPLTCSTHDVRQAGKWLIAIGKTEGVSGAVSFTNPGATECVITDLLPNTVYGAITSTAGGTLRFSLPAGTTTISVSPGATAPPTDYSALYTAEVAAHLADNAANAATIAALTGNLATTIGQRDALQKKMDGLAAALKMVLGIP